MPETIAHLGTVGTFTHQAALAHHGSAAAMLSCPTIPEVFEAVELGHADRGVVPVENSTEGGVTYTLDALLDTKLSITAEIVLSVEHCLITHAGGIDAVERVCSHPQALAQCRRWLRENLPGAVQEATTSTTAAVEVASQSANVAAIASAVASSSLGVPILRSGIQDSSHNATRFIVVSHDDAPPTGHDKTSIAFSTRDERGALCSALRLFDAEGINLCRIESRPRRERLWEYLFFTDIEGHRTDPNVSRALSRLRDSGAEVRVFGSYPRHDRDSKGS